MRVGIIGGGSIGLLFAAYFQKNGHDVTVYVKREEQYTRLLNSGLVLQTLTTTFSSTPEVKIFQSAKKEFHDLLIVAVKSYDLEHVLPVVKSCFTDSRYLLLLQNGMKHTRWLSDLCMFSVYLGIVEHGALRDSDTKVLHTGIGQTKIAPYLIEGTGLDWGGLTFDSFPFQQKADWYKMLSRKLLINAVINPLTALYKVRNGELLERNTFIQKMEVLFKEICKVLDVEDKERSWKELVTVCKNTSNNKSSMLRDIERGNKTEIEAITGYVLIMAEQQNIHLPYNQFVFETIKGLEERRDPDG
ncbi:2-dehydropantoate 2-reductase [Alkalihalobacillus sp. AL-G]|uniref:2-dehydropantoate 2-reductase n=1 Tax=Alkalihalobacillus sp. AL-G TaxID=2926399 RepID=UPI00272BCF7B|nr:2-dehydropantoate 2-reductase [Alkalihalobacillus sp. AL-G]WLD95055.1 2-dehydropantoate 2-reductase [Alkalihalobacillus sp. AL-G]